MFYTKNFFEIPFIVLKQENIMAWKAIKFSKNLNKEPPSNSTN